MELYHYGIKGQKWGVRRYQNEDGSLTSAGRIHYGVGEGAARRREELNFKRYGVTEVSESVKKLIAEDRENYETNNKQPTNIKQNTNLYRVTTNNDNNIRDLTYVYTNKNENKESYYDSLGADGFIYFNQEGLGKWDSTFYKKTLLNTKVKSIAPQKEVEKIVRKYIDQYKDVSLAEIGVGFYDDHKKASRVTGAIAYENPTNKNLSNYDMRSMMKLAKDFGSERSLNEYLQKNLSKKYDAIIDYEDYGDKNLLDDYDSNSKDVVPYILLNNKNIKIKKIDTII